MYNPFTLKNKIILVTGASSGIGKGIAIDCSKMGASLIITGRNKERLQETFDLLKGENHVQLLADLSEQDNIKTFVRQLPEIDGCVLCAGIYHASPVKHIKYDAINKVLLANVTSTMILTSMVYKKIKKNGSIVCVASLAGRYVNVTGEGIYAASKAALIGFMKTVSLEYAKKGIRVNNICPFIIQSELFQNSNTNFEKEELNETIKNKCLIKRMGQPTDIANGAIYLLSDASTWVTGIDLIIDGGYTIL